MRRGALVLLSFIVALALSAQEFPRKVEKVHAATVGILTYKSGVLKSSGTGVYVGDNGNLLSSYSLFVGCDSAVAIDSKGVVRRVLRVVGADELYDCVKLRTSVDKKIKYLQLSGGSASQGDRLFLLPYSFQPESVHVSKIDNYSGSPYYTLAVTMQEHFLSAPLVDAQGCVVALMQPVAPYEKTVSYAISAHFVDALRLTPMDFSSSKYRAIGIPPALPDNQEDALTTLHLQKMSYDTRYFNALNDYIALYPKNYDGYMQLAEKYAVHDNNRDAAERMWKKALALADNKGDVHYNKATVLLRLMNEVQDSVAKMKLSGDALVCLDRACKESCEPLYMQTMAELYHRLGDYHKAFPCYLALYRTNMATFDTFINAALCKESVGDYDAAAEQLDSAVVILGDSYKPDATLVKANLYVRAENYRKAVLEYNTYENSTPRPLDAEFYYIRAGVEVAAKMYKQALDDYDKALERSPDNLMYMLDKGRLYYRVKYFDEALSIFEKMIAIDSELPDAYYLAALCHIQEGDSDSALSKLIKAQELGHPMAAEKLKELK